MSKEGATSGRLPQRTKRYQLLRAPKQGRTNSRGKMQNDGKLAGETAKCDGWGLDKEIDP